jgi:hypothetical protein
MGEVTGAAVSEGERAVGDLADQRLDELVLPPLRRPGIRFQLHELTTRKVAQPLLDGRRVDAADRCQRRDVEHLSED